MRMKSENNVGDIICSSYVLCAELKAYVQGGVMYGLTYAIVCLNNVVNYKHMFLSSY